MSFCKSIGWLLLITVIINPLVSIGQDLNFINSNNLIMSGSAFLVIKNSATSNNTTFTNNKTVTCNNSSTIDIISYGPAYISGTNPPSFRNLTVDLNSKDPANPNILTLNTIITVFGNLTFASDGLIELNGKIITLGSNASGQIVNETNTARITGINGGTITKSVNMSSPNPQTNVNFGNIGLVLSTTGNLGNVTVFRGHTLQTNSAGDGFAGVYRYYDVRPTLNPGGNNITVKFSYLNAEVTKAPVDYTNSKDQLTLWNNQESTRGFWLLTDRDAYDATNDWVLKSGLPTLTSASPSNMRFTLSSTTTKPLPITLLHFTGSLSGGVSNLIWSISNDGSLHHFELERSQDAVSFLKLSDILPGLSTSSVEDYRYSDQHPYTPVTYYRLKIVDKTQKYFYSNVVKLKAGNEITALIYPNPATDHTYLSFSSLTEGNTSIQLFNSAGQLLRSKTISFHKGDNVFEVSLEGLPKGMYVVRSKGITLNHNMLIKN
jgi:hypothetical protein